MILYPHSKINIGLSIVNKRFDGFHDIETIFFPIPIYDKLIVEPTKNSKFEKLDFTCSDFELISDDNLCCKAYRLLYEKFGLPPTKIHLEKQIPFGAGLGGGSSDAAHVLLALNDLYDLNISFDKLTHYASQLGSDCAFFLQKLPAFGTGRGNILKNIDLSLKNYNILLLKPAISISTAEAYSCIVPKKPQYNLSEIVNLPIVEWQNTILNDFEDIIFKKYPQIEQIKALLYSQGAVYASMSGTGACVYGIFENLPEKMPNIPDCLCFKFVNLF
jgi:4-diphosphocytidyl-2-C-methyl-D-erythritol kinase